MVGVAGFEPATPASRTRCSTRLSHTPKLGGRYIEEGPPSGNGLGREALSVGAIGGRRCAWRAPALFPPAGPRRQAPPVPAGEWCNGNTAVFGTVILGSSPSSPAKTTTGRTGCASKRHIYLAARGRLRRQRPASSRQSQLPMNSRQGLELSAPRDVGRQSVASRLTSRPAVTPKPPGPGAPTHAGANLSRRNSPLRTNFGLRRRSRIP